MQIDFHYYATCCAAILAGYSHAESLSLAFACQFVDVCSATLLKKMRAPVSAATTQLQSELVNQWTDPVGLHEITRIWASFHFLPYDLYAPLNIRSRAYRDKYRLICRPNGKLVKETVLLAKGKGLPAAGLAMHVLADTWAHAYFAGTPSFVINNTDPYFYELRSEDGEVRKCRISFRHNPGAADDPAAGHYIGSMYTTGENSIMNLGHGRAGHLPDYSYITYEYMPAWGGYDVIVKDNPSEYYLAFCQMIYALQYLRREAPDGEDGFETETYAFETAAPWEDRIRGILTKRQTDASADWKAFGEELSGQEIPDFDPLRYEEEYCRAAEADRDRTEAGQFILAALNQKSMVTGEIFRSGSRLAGFAVDFRKKGFRGIRDFKKLAARWQEEDR